MKSLATMPYRVKRVLLQGFSLATMAFVFQACYGMPQDRRMDVLIKGKVLCSQDNTPAQGVTVNVGNIVQSTNSVGEFELYAVLQDEYAFAIDGGRAYKDTLIEHTYSQDAQQLGTNAQPLEVTLYVNPK